MGQLQNSEKLRLLAEKGRLPHLLLFSGPKGSGKRACAECVAREFLKLGEQEVAPDLHLYLPEGKTGMHSVQAVKRLIDEVIVEPFGGYGKVFIIVDAERMLPSAANALLKTLEEPPEKTLIMLLTSRKDRMLPTILSRCQEVRFSPQQAEELLALKMPVGFIEIAQFAKEFQKSIDSKKKVREQELKKEFSDVLKEATSSQKQLIEQEIEGALALIAQEEVDHLFTQILAFAVDRERKASTNKFSKVLKSLADAKMAIERSSPIGSTIESLLLAC